MRISLRAARQDEADLLTEIACRSKAHWGYSPDQIAAWRPAFLTVTADYIARHSPVVAVDDECGPVAFAALERGRRARRWSIFGCCPSAWDAALARVFFDISPG